MGITYGDHLIDSGYHDITPEQEREIEARQECAHRGIDPDEICADGGITAWMVVDRERSDPMAFSWWGSDAPTHAMVDITRASESIAAMVADWYGNAPLPNARITPDVIAQRLARFVMQPPAGETIRTTQDGSMEAAPVTGQSPVGAASTNEMQEALEYAREKMWAYGFSEDDLRPVREAIANARVCA